MYNLISPFEVGHKENTKMKNTINLNQNLNGLSIDETAKVNAFIEKAKEETDGKRSRFRDHITAETVARKEQLDEKIIAYKAAIKDGDKARIDRIFAEIAGEPKIKEIIKIKTRLTWLKIQTFADSVVDAEDINQILLTMLDKALRMYNPDKATNFVTYYDTAAANTLRNLARDQYHNHTKSNSASSGLVISTKIKNRLSAVSVKYASDILDDFDFDDFDFDFGRGANPHGMMGLPESAIEYASVTAYKEGLQDIHVVDKCDEDDLDKESKSEMRCNLIIKTIKAAIRKDLKQLIKAEKGVWQQKRLQDAMVYIDTLKPVSFGEKINKDKVNKKYSLSYDRQMMSAEIVKEYAIKTKVADLLAD